MNRTPEGLKREYFMIKKRVLACPCWCGGNHPTEGVVKNKCLNQVSCEDRICRAQEILREVDIEDKWANTHAWWLAPDLPSDAEVPGN